MTLHHDLQADEEAQYAYVVFSPGGGFCIAHVGPEAEFTSGAHAATVKGFVVKFPVFEDYREYKS